eukprot:CAMPEP_0176069350 /NCGR_PEP_ID=MMETSP0120_2-20121206/34624_1 /TAXON_ID=160619 /ORGANISM="Kryptoperidinium foliaceum, Strain CCMP 1326" /LENGTH=261 /DNA_ID=CAMNT_0017402981 /DNA_START=30 /DNA_END=815 /DNA_ORIENTATION=+
MFIHCCFVLWNWVPKLWRSDAIAVLLVYHFFFLNLLASFFQCVITDPGMVPPNWGFYMGDETKRRRYCKMCNVWKPDRTHHCSVCNRCILNMDHHCPWINNCVGFYNRKFFIQLLVYVYLSLGVVVTTTPWEMLCRVMILWRGMWAKGQTPSDAMFVASTCLLGLAFSLSVCLVCTLTNFIRFHVRLVVDNYTTIENLEREEKAKSKFDIGRRRNMEQVFGSSHLLWWLPLHTQASRPVGDGVRWRVQYTRLDDEEELEAD